jgi:hypothetical protein
MGPGARGPGARGPGNPYGNGSRQAAFEAQLKRFDGPSGVKIFVNVPDNQQKFVKSLAAKLQIGEYACRSTGGTTLIAIRFSGSLDEVEKAIDFGTVTSTDPVKREIQVDAGQ